MKTFFFLLLSIVISVNTYAQKSGDAKLDVRLVKYMELNRNLNFSELMDYVHPSLFEIVTREQFLSTFKEIFDNDEMKMTIDSTSILSISKPMTVNGRSFRSIPYFMTMSLYFKDTATSSDPEFQAIMIDALEKGFGGAKVEFNKKTKKFSISTSQGMVAIRDSEKGEWFFLGVEKNQTELTKRLIPEEVIREFKLL